LALSFYFIVRYSRHEALRTEEFAYGCDSFGYLRMAKQVRSGFSHGERPEFKLESTQTRALIDFMKEKKVPLSTWEEVVAPHAHHYFPRSDFVGVQYPPGTALALAMFPQGEAVYGLNRVVVFIFGLLGVIALLVAIWKRTWASIALLMFAFSLGLFVLVRIGGASFSINASLVPVLLTCFLSLGALWLNNSLRHYPALLCAFLAGLSLGFATLVRLPTFLLLPGLVILLWPGLRNLFRFTSLPLALVLGTAIAGVIPVLINQNDVTGAWYLSTYASVDAAAPTFERLRINLSFFLGSGPAAVDNRALLYAILGFAGFLILYVKSDNANSSPLGISWKRLALAAAVLWALPLVYFLTHWVTAPHYMIPSVLATMTLMGAGAFSLELDNEIPFDRRRVASWIALVLLLAPGFVMLKRAWRVRSELPDPVEARTHSPIVLPSELVDDKAWIWADLLTGSLWYYANKPAFKIQFTDEQTRAMIFKFVHERADRQYLLQDSEQMKKYMEEITSRGGRLEPRGKVDGQPYYLVVCSDGGPR
jgi:hypothetical protein